jgi:nicotinamide-nucleotide amidase
MFPTELLMVARLVLAEAEERRLKIVTAESCTGGLIAACLTEIPGSSSVMERGFVTYSNQSKQDMLGVPGDLIADVGAVSEAVARSMAEGALRESRAHIAIAVTGVAGPGGGTPLKPVGLVHLACARDNHRLRHESLHLGPLPRGEIRLRTVEKALEMVRSMMGAGGGGSSWT